MCDSRPHPKVTTQGCPLHSLWVGTPSPTHLPREGVSPGSQPTQTGSGREARPVLPGVRPTGMVPRGGRTGSELGPARPGRGGSLLGQDLGRPERFQRRAGRARAAGYQVPPILTSAPPSGPQPSPLRPDRGPPSPITLSSQASSLSPCPKTPPPSGLTPATPQPSFLHLFGTGHALGPFWGLRAAPTFSWARLQGVGSLLAHGSVAAPSCAAVLAGGRRPAQPMHWAAFGG